MSTQSEQDAGGVPVDTFELRLAIARMHAGGISAREAGFRVGVSGQAWRNWESGQSIGARKPAMLSFISRQLHVDEEWLRDGGPLRAAEDPRPDGPDGGREECAIRDSNPEPAGLEHPPVRHLRMMWPMTGPSERLRPAAAAA